MQNQEKMRTAHLISEKCIIEVLPSRLMSTTVIEVVGPPSEHLGLDALISVLSNDDHQMPVGLQKQFRYSLKMSPACIIIPPDSVSGRGTVPMSYILGGESGYPIYEFPVVHLGGKTLQQGYQLLVKVLAYENH